MVPSASANGKKAKEEVDRIVNGLQDYIAGLVEQGKAKPEDFDVVYEIFNDDEKEKEKKE